MSADDMTDLSDETLSRMLGCAGLDMPTSAWRPLVLALRASRAREAEMVSFLGRLNEGILVGSHAFSAQEIATARAQGRMLVTQDGLGYIHVRGIGKLSHDAEKARAEAAEAKAAELTATMREHVQRVVEAEHARDHIQWRHDDITARAETAEAKIIELTTEIERLREGDGGFALDTERQNRRHADAAAAAAEAQAAELTAEVTRLLEAEHHAVLRGNRLASQAQDLVAEREKVIDALGVREDIACGRDLVEAAQSMTNGLNAGLDDIAKLQADLIDARILSGERVSSLLSDALMEWRRLGEGEQIMLLHFLHGADCELATVTAARDLLRVALADDAASDAEVTK
jgi:hypothetical protein